MSATPTNLADGVSSRYLPTIARIVVIAAAYHGDVMPFVGPANRLVERGHDVTFVVPVGFHNDLAGERFALAPYPVDFSTAGMHADPVHQRIIRRPKLNTARLVRYWMRQTLITAPEAVRSALTEAFRGADVVVSHATMCVVAVPVARSLGVPIVVGHLFPQMVPNVATWCSPSARRGLAGAAKAVVWNLFTCASGRLFYDRRVNVWRRGLGMGPTRAAVVLGWMEADRNVVLTSRHYMADGVPDWPPVTWGGFSHWTPHPRRRPDPRVDAFLDAGEAPVLVTLGTSGATGAGRDFATIAAGLDELGLRSLLLVGNRDNLAAVGGRAGAFVFIPLAHVLPRCRIAVVSGALGSTAAALAAGVPVVVVPKLLDQIWHGEQVEKLGVGVAARTPRGVRQAVARIEADPGYRARAAALAAKLATEDGATALADAAESLIPTPQAAPRP